MIHGRDLRVKLSVSELRGSTRRSRNTCFMYGDDLVNRIRIISRPVLNNTIWLLAFRLLVLGLLYVQEPPWVKTK